uniref:Transmembrane protein n=1 Tax=viral metagenome TaxID=1070528 RepID=A0A6C0D0K8_9ZZZZ
MEDQIVQIPKLSNFSNLVVQFLLGPKVYGLFTAVNKTTSWIETITMMDIIRILLITYKLYFIVHKLYTIFISDSSTPTEKIEDMSFTEQPFFKQLPWWKYLFIGRWGTICLVNGLFSGICCLGSMYLHNDIKLQMREISKETYDTFLVNMKNQTFLGLLFLMYIIINGSFFLLLDASNTFDSTARDIHIASTITSSSIEDYAVEDFMIFATIVLLFLPFLYQYFKDLPGKKICGIMLLLLSIVFPFLYTLYMRVVCFSGTWNVLKRIFEYFIENLPEFVILIYFSFYFSFSFELYESVDTIIHSRQSIMQWFARNGAFLFLVLTTVGCISLRRNIIHRKWLQNWKYKKFITNLCTLLIYILCASVFALAKYKCGLSNCLQQKQQYTTQKLTQQQQF